MLVYFKNKHGEIVEIDIEPKHILWYQGRNNKENCWCLVKLFDNFYSKRVVTRNLENLGKVLLKNWPKFQKY